MYNLVITLLIASLGFVSFNPLIAELSSQQNDVTYTFSGAFRPESFAAKNIVLLNNANCGLDKLWYARHTLDLSCAVKWGSLEKGKSVVDFLLSIRNKSLWGSPGTNASTNEETFRLGDAVTGAHKHTIPRHIFWMREAWLGINIGRLFNVNFDTHHFFQIGAFPFKLGRGIALGSSFAVGPDLLGFYSDSLVDQYAFGAKFSGDLFRDIVLYDIYASILDNKSGSFGDVNAKTRGQEYGRIATPARGFGKMNYIIAAHLMIKPCLEKQHKLSFEPYALFNSEAEQKVEFRGDASSRLGTIGFAMEYDGPCGDFGFDTAINMGYQEVKGWDRNGITISVDSSTGIVGLQNSHVVNNDPTKKTPKAVPVPFAKDGDRQTLIKDTLQDKSENGQKIGTDSTGQALFNALKRFRNPYSNKYKGWMFVADAATRSFCDIKFGIGGGIASGDDNPNEVTQDEEYSGFIGLQETYAGRRVKSAFLMAGSGKIKRPLSLRNPVREKGDFAQSLSGFTNIGYGGASLLWKPKREDEIMVNSNIIGYWQPKATRKFDILTGQDTKEFASNNLGIEINVFAHYIPVSSIQLFCVGAVFLPGQHYSDIKGVPLNKDQQELLDRLDDTGFNADRIPNLGDDWAYTFNAGINYSF